MIWKINLIFLIKILKKNNLNIKTYVFIIFFAAYLGRCFMYNLLHIYALCITALFIKMFAISCYQGYFRIKNKAFKNKEDAQYLNMNAHPEELPQVVRASQAWANDLENIPVFWVLGGICIALNLNTTLIAWTFSVFTIARIAHTITYLVGIQPWRTISYITGIVCLFILTFNIILACL